jgi:hypothetical protein
MPISGLIALSLPLTLVDFAIHILFPRFKIQSISLPDLLDEIMERFLGLNFELLYNF